MRLERFRKEHARLYNGFGGQEAIAPFMMAEEMLEPAAACDAWAGFEGDIFLGAGGTVEVSNYRAIAWALLNPTNPRYFYKVTRVARRVMDAASEKYARLEC